jgi:DNA-binding response OmpR family regulator
MKKSVLVVDDDDAIRTLVSRVFARKGYDVVSASDGDEAIDLLKRQSFALVVLDLMMPRTDGISVIKEIGRIGNQPAIIVMTAAVPAVVERVPDAHVWKIVAKPFNVIELLSDAENAINARTSSAAPPT